MAAAGGGDMAGRLRRVFASGMLDAIKVLRSETKCMVCCENFEDPYQCANGHSYCKECIQRAMRAQSMCPECRIPLGRRDIKPNRKLSEIVMGARTLLSDELLDDVTAISAAVAKARPLPATELAPPSAESSPEQPPRAGRAGDRASAAAPRRLVIAETHTQHGRAGMLSRLVALARSEGMEASAVSSFPADGQAGGRVTSLTHVVVGRSGLVAGGGHVFPGTEGAAVAAREGSASTAATAAADGAGSPEAPPAGTPLWVANRTPKYLAGLGTGAWVVSVGWVADSLAAGRVLPEGQYELRGDLKAAAGPARNRRRVLAALEAVEEADAAAAAAAATSPSAASALGGRRGVPAEVPLSAAPVLHKEAVPTRWPPLLDGCVVVAPPVRCGDQRFALATAMAAGCAALFPVASIGQAVVVASTNGLALRVLVSGRRGSDADCARAAVTAAMALGVLDADAVRCHWLYDSLSRASKLPAGPFSVLSSRSAALAARPRIPETIDDEPGSGLRCGCIPADLVSRALKETSDGLALCRASGAPPPGGDAHRVWQEYTPAMVGLLAGATLRLRLASNPDLQGGPASAARHHGPGPRELSGQTHARRGVVG